MVANEFQLLKAFIEIDTRGSTLSFRRLNAQLTTIENRIRSLNTRSGINRIVSPLAFRQIDLLNRKLRQARTLSRGIVIVGGAAGAGGVAAGAAAARARGGVSGVGGGRIAQAATFGLLAGNLRGQVSGAAQAGILGGAVGGVGLGAGLLAGVGGSIIVKRSSEVAANFESIEVALQGIIRDETRVAQLLGELRDVSLETSTNFFQDLTPSTIGLLGSGFSPEEIPALLKQLADLSVITEKNGVTFAELASKVARNKTQFRQLTRDVREYTNAGINLLPSLQNQLGVFSNEEVFDQIEQGNVTIDNILQAFTDLTSEGGIAFKLQANAAETFNFQLEKLRENITFLGKNIGDRFLPSLNRAAVALNELFVEPPKRVEEQAITQQALERVTERSPEEARLTRRQRELQAEVARLESEQVTQQAIRGVTDIAGLIFGIIPRRPLRVTPTGVRLEETPEQRQLQLLQTQIQQLQREIIVERGEGGLSELEAARRVLRRGTLGLRDTLIDAGGFVPGALAGGAAAALGLTLGGVSGAVQLGAAGAEFDPTEFGKQASQFLSGVAAGDITLFTPAESAFFKELPFIAKTNAVSTKTFETAVTKFGQFVGDLEGQRLQAEQTQLIIEVRRIGQP